MKKLYELSVAVMLKQDIHYQESTEKIGEHINKSMLLDQELKQFHRLKGRQYKHYVFSNMYPIEKDKCYKQGRIYTINIRSFHKDFIFKMRRLIEKVNDSILQVIFTKVKTIRRRLISELHTVNPVIITIENEPFFKKNTETIKSRIEENLLKKYEHLNNKQINLQKSFVDKIEILSKEPVVTWYKGIKMLGHKINLYLSVDEQSQELGYLALGSGIGEKNSSIGSGFCLGKFF